MFAAAGLAQQPHLKGRLGMMFTNTSYNNLDYSGPRNRKRWATFYIHARQNIALLYLALTPIFL